MTPFEQLKERIEAMDPGRKRDEMVSLLKDKARKVGQK